jgi:hypothetical protein
MKSRLPKLNYANVIATIALFVALSGVAVAAGLPRNSVGANQLKRGAVTAAKLKKGAVTSGKLGPKSVTAGKLGPNAILPGNIGNGAITSAKIGAGAVIASSIKNGVITTNKLAAKAVTDDKLGAKAVNTEKLAANAVTNPIIANGSVTPNKLSKEFGPIVETLKTGQTLRGSFAVGGGGTKTEPKDEAYGAISYPFPLSKAPNATVVQMGQTTANCAGAGSDNQTPQATPGHVCVYISGWQNIEPAANPLVTLNDSRIGLGLALQAKNAGAPFAAYGLWAVTAP